MDADSSCAALSGRCTVCYVAAEHPTGQHIQLNIFLHITIYKYIYIYIYIYIQR